MTLRTVFQVSVCGLVLACNTGPRAEGGAAEKHVGNLRDSPASATTPFNAKVIEEFRANAGKPGGAFANSQLLLLHTTGAKSRQPRLTPLVYLAEGDRLVVIASNGGAAKHPAWYHNLVANPKVGVEVGIEQFYAQATVAEEPERTTLYAKMAAKSPTFAAYQQKAGPRVIPVIILTRTP